MNTLLKADTDDSCKAHVFEVTDFTECEPGEARDLLIKDISLTVGGKLKDIIRATPKGQRTRKSNALFGRLLTTCVSKDGVSLEQQRALIDYYVPLMKVLNPRFQLDSRTLTQHGPYTSADAQKIIAATSLISSSQ